MAVKIGQVMIYVRDLEVSRVFYCEVLGLEIETDLSEQLNMLVLKNEGCLFTLHGGYQAVNTSLDVCRTTVIFSVESLQEVKQRLQLGSYQMIGETEETPIHWFQLVKDPDGNLIEIAKFK